MHDIYFKFIFIILFNKILQNKYMNQPGAIFPTNIVAKLTRLMMCPDLAPTHTM